MKTVTVFVLKCKNGKVLQSQKAIVLQLLDGQKVNTRLRYTRNNNTVTAWKRQAFFYKKNMEEKKINYKPSTGKSYSSYYNIIVHFIPQVCDRLFIEKEEGLKILLENIEDVRDEILEIQKKKNTKSLYLKNEDLITVLCKIIVKNFY